MNTRGQKWLVAVAIIASLFWATIKGTAQERYYVDDGERIIAANGDTRSVQAAEWQVRLYKSGARTGGKDSWGLITGKSAADVMQQLEDAQDFQVRYAKFAGIDYTSELFTYFNPLGPIAVLKPLMPVPTDRLKQASDLIDKVKGLGKIYKRIEAILRTRPKSSNPYQNVGKVLLEYGKNLKNVEKALAELLGKIKDTSQGIDEINSTMDQFITDLEKTEAQSQTLQSEFIKFLPDLAPPAPDAELKIKYWEGYPTELYYLVGDKRQGHSISFSISGTSDGITSTHKEEEGEYREDKKHGHWIESGASNCVREGDYDNGRKVGIWRKYCQMQEQVWQTPIDYDSGGLEDSSNTTLINSFPAHLLEFLNRAGVFVVSR